MEKSQGLSLAVDLGGTNLRVCSVDLHGDTTYSVKQSSISIPREIMVARLAAELFSFIAKQVRDFLEAHHKSCLQTPAFKAIPEGRENQSSFSLGFTFSFPAYQTGIDSGTLLRWTKGFDIEDAVGKDVCKLLQHEIDLLDLPVRVTALVNDAAGTIMSRAYTLPVSETRTSIGAIFGTGTNGVYLEKLSKITKPLDGRYDRSTGEMFVSIEWGSFDNHLSILPNTPYDAQLNEFSVNPGNQMFEKRVSGMFLGELLRIAIFAMHTDPSISLFHGYKSSAASTADESPLYTRWTVDSSILSIAEADNSAELNVLRQKIEDDLHIPPANISITDARAVKEIAHAIGKRAARLAGMAIGAVVLQSGRLFDHLDPQPRGAESGNGIEGGDIAKSSNTTASESVSPAMSQDGNICCPENEHHIVDIGVDGSVVEFYPGFEAYMREALRAIPEIASAGEKRIRIGIAKDGSGVGAAIIALLATQQ
ncbi:hypothetical protein FGG08_004245 [Glutinoglossum americanum]|uniref:Phosphotransferase n=1 Tax=Glutinoglossum americanum TaxID=1670608 RepID=A0A9P8HWQ8_9PEZI|nr:hypothetical protein FGG08_004245 [Glutinoglossum americanum]